ncbi:MAG: ammonium transporter [Verrucomicrobia bacterium]|nr:MAG: ammonium transporter [Verrucomicrobiota bacterium]
MAVVTGSAFAQAPSATSNTAPAVAAIAAPPVAAPAAAPAAPTPPTAKDVNSGDNAWVLISSALVLLMTVPALAFFYGGLVRRKNVLSVLMQCFILACVISIQWVLFGYSLAFGPDIKHLIGNLDWAFLKNVSIDTPHWDAVTASSYAGTIPHQSFMIFQMMFAVITPGLIIGSFAERMKFSAFLVFAILWATIVYDPVAHWVWGKNGFLGLMGALDFAGGTVVHINAGIAGLVTALVLGKRIGYPDRMSPPHNLPFAVLGAALLWVGWFGFNAGSALSAGGLATSAFVVTHVATAAAGLTWALMDWIFNKRPTLLGVISGAVGGLVAITPASGFVNVMGAIGIGVGAGILPWIFVSIIKPKLGYDDALDAFGVHGVGGTWGAIATGLWATKTINSAGADGLFYGNPAQLLIQLKAVGVTIVYSLVVSFILLKIVDLVMGLRAEPQAEKIGLDLTDHRETGYTVLD